MQSNSKSNSVEKQNFDIANYNYPLTRDQKRSASDQLGRVFNSKKIKTVLLISPPNGDKSLFRESVAKRKNYENHPQYGLGVIAAHLKKAGIKVNLLNLNNIILKEARSLSNGGFDFSKILDKNLNLFGDAIALTDPEFS